MGAVFAFASGTSDITTARPDDIATGTRATFALAAPLIVVGLAVAVGTQALARRSSKSRHMAGSPGSPRHSQPGLAPVKVQSRQSRTGNVALTVHPDQGRSG
jgi:hypothetical protein